MRNFILILLLTVGFSTVTTAQRAIKGVDPKDSTMSSYIPAGSPIEFFVSKDHFERMLSETIADVIPTGYTDTTRAMWRYYGRVVSLRGVSAIPTIYLTAKAGDSIDIQTYYRWVTFTGNTLAVTPWTVFGTLVSIRYVYNLTTATTPDTAIRVNPTVAAAPAVQPDSVLWRYGTGYWQVMYEVTQKRAFTVAAGVTNKVIAYNTDKKQNPLWRGESILVGRRDEGR
jgi:hypothetical protein